MTQVDIDNSEEQGRTVVKQGLDRDLDRMKDQYDGLESLLKHVATDIATTIPAELNIELNVIYFPQLGFHVSIPLNLRGEAAYLGSDESWELVFITENRAYFKDFRMRELDGKLGDLYGLICGRSHSQKEWSICLTQLCSQRKRSRSCTTLLNEFFNTRRY